jgi:hypothetical protein
MSPAQRALDTDFQSLQRVIDFYGKDTVKSTLTIGYGEGNSTYMGIEARDTTTAAAIIDALFP